MGRKSRDTLGPKLVAENPMIPKTNEHANLAEQRNMMTEAKTPEERLAALDEICGRTFGKGIQMSTLRGVHGLREEVRGVIHTGSFGLDIALGVGGLPRGRIVEIYGDYASGKTTLALHCVHQCQKAGGIAAFVDVEHALDPNYAQALGVDLDSTLGYQPDNGEQALQTVSHLVETGKVDLVVIDSVAALVPQKELDGEIGDHNPGGQARLMGQALRIMTPKIARSNAVVIFLNQMREKIGVTFGSPKTTSGGKALPFYASIRIETTKLGALSANDEKFGSRTRLNVVKNKVAPPFRSCEVDIIWGKGISMFGELLDYGSQYGLIQKSGSWYNYGDIRLGQGKENAILTLQGNESLAEELVGLLAQKLTR